MIRLVIADDHAVFRQGLAALLQRVEDFRLVGQAGNGLELERVVAETAPHVAVVDVSMPHHNAAQLPRTWRDHGCPTRIVALTQHRAPAVVRPILQAGVDAFVLKENAFEDVVQAIRCAHEGRGFISPLLARELAQADSAAAAPLAPREIQVLGWIARGRTNKEIAQTLGISPDTVRTHRNRIMEKLDLHNAAELTRYAIERGLLEGLR